MFERGRKQLHAYLLTEGIWLISEASDGYLISLEDFLKAETYRKKVLRAGLQNQEPKTAEETAEGFFIKTIREKLFGLPACVELPKNKITIIIVFNGKNYSINNGDGTLTLTIYIVRPSSSSPNTSNAFSLSSAIILALVLIGISIYPLFVRIWGIRKLTRWKFLNGLYSIVPAPVRNLALRGTLPSVAGGEYPRFLTGFRL
jgi:hypothetical protein